MYNEVPGYSESPSLGPINDFVLDPANLNSTVTINDQGVPSQESSVWGWLPSFNSARNSSTVVNYQVAFNNSWNQECYRTKQEIFVDSTQQQERQERFDAEATARKEKIEQHFSDDFFLKAHQEDFSSSLNLSNNGEGMAAKVKNNARDLKDSKSISSHFIQTIYREMLQELMLLRANYATPQQLAVTKGTTHPGMTSPSYSLMRPAPPIKNIVFSGGGVKGSANAGALEALAFAGYLDDIDHFIGSSVGAITASLLASGMSVQEFKRASNAIKYEDFLQESSQKLPVQEKIQTVDGIGVSGFLGMENIHQYMNRSLRNFFEQTPASWLGEKPAMKSLRERIMAEDGLDQVFLTFGELHLLHQHYPKRFKNLTITGFRIATDQETSKPMYQEVYYNHHNEPNTSLVDAVRASMALPLIFDPVKIGASVIEDGGIGSNTPTEVLHPGLRTDLENLLTWHYNKKEEEILKEFIEQQNLFGHQKLAENTLHSAETLILGFDSNGWLDNVLFRHQFKVFGVAAELQKVISKNPKFKRDAMADNIKLWHGGPNTLKVTHGTLEIASFRASPEEIHAAQLQAEIKMLEQLYLRQNQALYQVYGDLNEVLTQLSFTEIRAIAADPRTDPIIAEELRAIVRSRLNCTIS